MANNNPIPAPNKLWIAVTNICNLRCSHCLIKSGLKYESELTKAEIFKIIDDAIELGVKRIAFTGGEPLIRSDIFEIIKYASKYNIRTYLETNGMLLSSKVISLLKKSNLGVLNLSLDGPDRHTHDAFRGARGLFDRVIANIKYALELDMDVRVYCTVTRNNISEVLKLPELFRSMPRIKVLTFAYYVPFGRGGGEMVISSVEWRLFCKKLKILISEYRGIFDIRYEPVYLTKNEHEILRKDLLYNISCLAREKDWVYISADGRVYGCILLVNTQKKLGSIRINNLSQIWLQSRGWSFFGSCQQYCPAYKLQSSNIDKNIYQNKKLRFICPLVQYPKIESWPYERKLKK